jgi:hypothetical protein
MTKEQANALKELEQHALIALGNLFPLPVDSPFSPGGIQDKMAKGAQRFMMRTPEQGAAEKRIRDFRGALESLIAAINTYRGGEPR